MIALPVPVTDTRVLTGRGPLVAAAAGQLGASASSAACISKLREPGNFLQDVRQWSALGEQLVGCGRGYGGRQYRTRHGRRRFLRDLAVLKGNLRPSSDLHPILGATSKPASSFSCSDISAAEASGASAPASSPSAQRPRWRRRQPVLEPGARWESGPRTVSVTCCLIRSSARRTWTSASRPVNRPNVAPNNGMTRRNSAVLMTKP